MTQPSDETVQAMYRFFEECGAMQRVIEKYYKDEEVKKWEHY